MSRLFVISILFFLSNTTMAEDVPRTVVSVVVDGGDIRHVQEVVSEAKKLSSKVPIRNLLLIQKLPTTPKITAEKTQLNPAEQEALTKNMQQMQQTMNLVKELQLDQAQGANDLKVLDRLRISYSPTWVVRHKGRNYIYEGYQSIDKFFSNSGIFKEGD